MKPGRRLQIPGPDRPDAPHPALAGLPVSIVFGHNADEGKVLMMFSAQADRLIFSPEDADHVAAQLQLRAKLARGEQS